MDSNADLSASVIVKTLEFAEQHESGWIILVLILLAVGESPGISLTKTVSNMRRRTRASYAEPQPVLVVILRCMRRIKIDASRQQEPVLFIKSNL